MKPRIRYPKLTSKTHPELKRLASLVGEFIRHWGFKSIQGRMWCYLYVIKQPLSSLELSQILEISPALVTQSVQVLMDYQVIFEAKKGRNGTLRFQANPNVAEAILNVLKSREIKLIEKIQTASESLKRSEAFGQKVGLVELDLDRIHRVNQWIVLAHFILDACMSNLASPDNFFSQPTQYKGNLNLSKESG